MRKVFGILSAVSFLYALGICGGIETDSIDLWPGFVRAIIGMLLFGLFAWFAGAFEPAYDDTEDEEAAAGRSSSHDGKRKSSNELYTNIGRKSRHG